MLSPKHSKVVRWNIVMLIAMFYVSTVTPYEVRLGRGVEVTKDHPHDELASGLSHSLVRFASLENSRVSHHHHTRHLPDRAAANRRTRTQVSVMTGDDRNGVLRTVNYVVDAVFACDMLLQFFVGFWDPSLKAMCYNPVIIARRYVSSWLAMDVVSIFPFDVRLIDRSIDRARVTHGE